MPSEALTIEDSARLQHALLEWAGENLRDLPWRSTRDPWAVLVSEVMLQQTQVDRVMQRHREFLELFPTPRACAAAPLAEVIRLWDGLGFNRRAVNLWTAAGQITERHDGRVPDDLTQLLDLPGVGPYTARAVLAFAFEHDVGVVDTNVGRLLARWTNRRLTPRQAQDLASSLVPDNAGWLWNQGLFDFANAQCTRRSPGCDHCALDSVCAWQGRGDDPAARSAGVSTPQSRFEGSPRQVRGQLVKALRTRALSTDALDDFATQAYPIEEIRSLAAGLVSEGLAEWRGGKLRLPSARSAAIQ